MANGPNFPLGVGRNQSRQRPQLGRKSFGGAGIRFATGPGIQTTGTKFRGSFFTGRRSDRRKGSPLHVDELEVRLHFGEERFLAERSLIHKNVFRIGNQLLHVADVGLRTSILDAGLQPRSTFVAKETVIDASQTSFAATLRGDYLRSPVRFGLLWCRRHRSKRKKHRIDRYHLH